jgi:hypothetical protein
MTRPAPFFVIALALGAMILVPRVAARADTREEGPTEIEKCQTIDKPGSYKLVRNLTFSVPSGGGDCLSITADFVTIDLAGFSISVLGGAGPGGGISSDRDGIIVRNGSISGPSLGLLQHGVSLLGFASLVEGVRVNFAVFFGISASGIVKGNTVTRTTAISGTGIFATGTVTGNLVVGNRNGMAIGQGSTVIGNTVTGNVDVGIFVDCPSNVTDNTAVNNGQANLVLGGNGCNNTNNVAP